jgi:hypothetical protein
MEILINHWQSFDFEIAILILITYVLLDGMYAYYTVSVTKKRPFSSASVGALMHFLIAFGVLNYVENYLYILPIALGSFIGTYVVVRYDFKFGI